MKGITSAELSSIIGDNLGISRRPSSWCATWLAVTRQCGFGAVGSLDICMIVCHAFRLLPVRSVDVNPIILRDLTQECRKKTSLIGTDITV